MIASAGGAGTRHLVDAEALVDALTARRIAGAGLDGFEREPNVPEA